jgi:hypothetical protein
VDPRVLGVMMLDMYKVYGEIECVFGAQGRFDWRDTGIEDDHEKSRACHSAFSVSPFLLASCLILIPPLAQCQLRDR